MAVSTQREKSTYQNIESFILLKNTGEYKWKDERCWHVEVLNIKSLSFAHIVMSDCRQILPINKQIAVGAIWIWVIREIEINHNIFFQW